MLWYFIIGCPVMQGFFPFLNKRLGRKVGEERKKFFKKGVAFPEKL
jgi:hypothetical protein